MTVVSLEQREVVDLGAVLLDSLHVLELDGVVQLEAYVVVHHVGNVHQVTLLLKIKKINIFSSSGFTKNLTLNSPLTALSNLRL